MAELERKKISKIQNVGVFAVIMAMGTFFSRILGLLRDIALAAVFDIHTKDAFILAMRFPNIFRRLLAEGSLSMAFIPVFQGFVGQGKKEEAKKLSSAVFSILLLVLGVLVALAIVYMDAIIALWASGDGFTRVPGKIELTVFMARWMFGFLFFICCYAFFMAILNTLGKYTMGALAPAILNVVLIVAFLLPSGVSLNEHAHIVAIAVLLGGALQALILLPQVWRSGYLPRLTCHWRVDGIKGFLSALLSGFFGTGVYQLTALINTSFASQGEGFVSWLYFADRLLSLPLSLVSVSLGAALLPALSDFWNRKDTQGFAKMANRFLRVNYFMAIPCTVGLYILSEPIIEVLYLRGEFTMEDVRVVASIVRVYALTLLVASGVRILVPSFYAIKKPLLPAIIGAACLLGHIVWTPILLQSLGVVGLALGTALTTALNLVCLLYFFRKYVGVVEIKKFIKSVAKFLVCAIVMAFVISSYGSLLTLLGSLSFAKTIALVLTIGIGAISYFSMSYLIKCDEGASFIHGILSKIKPKKS